MTDLAGRTAIVTGASRGFGRAIALGLAAAGAAVAVVSRSQAALDPVAAEIIAAGGRALAVAADVRDRSAVAHAVAAAETALGPIDILVNNAGHAGPYGPIGVADPDAWWAAQEVHLRGPLLFMSAVLPGMRSRRAGRIINVASLRGRKVTPHLSAYSVGKAAEIRLMEHVAAEGRDAGIVAFAIQPGIVVTEMAEETLTSPDALRWVPDMVEALRRRRAEEDPAPGLARCAEMCVGLASGRYDGLSGRFLEPEDDFDALLAAGGAR